jgi:hypothetical protein
MNWKCGSSSRVPALQVQNPEFKPQSHQKKRKKERKKSVIGKGLVTVDPARNS